MFHFPTFPPHALYIQARVTGLVIQPGFPIRKSSNHSSVASSSRLIAGSYVLHRLLVPRHPPCALKNLTTDTKMLASTMQFSSNERDPPPHPAPTPGRHTHHNPTQESRTGAAPRGRFDRRSGPTRPPTPNGAGDRPETTDTTAPVPSGPNSVPSRPTTPARSTHPANRTEY